jgi:hypothetical protein
VVEAISLNTNLLISDYQFTVDVNFGVARLFVTILVTIAIFQYEIQEYDNLDDERMSPEDESNLIQKLVLFKWA